MGTNLNGNLKVDWFVVELVELGEWHNQVHEMDYYK
jgi:hypothetical protein